MSNPDASHTNMQPALFWLCILCAGFLGACLRYACGLIPLPNPEGFPINTLLINMLGSFLIVVVFLKGGKQLSLNPQMVKICNSGFLGAFTTMSSFCTESLNLLVSGNYLAALLYVALTWILCFAAALLAAKLCKPMPKGGTR